MGSTQTAPQGNRMGKDHPHIHGEHGVIARDYIRRPGSPPYTWGAREDCALLAGQLGITPIYMGSTLYRSGGQWRTQDHPHIHGEHSGDTLSGIASQGSPPYTWGAPGKIKITNTATRITPIYMGSTRPRSYSGSSYKDHPHIHGEHPERSR